MFNTVKIKKTIKRVGRGPASGKGKTSGRGMNGQKCRTGASTIFKEGGQTNFFMRLPKAKGFKSHSKKRFSATDEQISRMFKEDEEIKFDEVVKRFKLSPYVKEVKVISSGKNFKFRYSEEILLSSALTTKDAKSN